jgi:pimeloyl-ACP methyl ester carboxylesterase
LTSLVLLHPLGADRHVWDPVLPRLSGEVIAIDMPGFGAEPPLRGNETVTPRELAEAVRTRLGHLDRPHVAGISLGGWVALELALAGWARSVTAIAPAGMWSAPLAPKRSTARIAARALAPALPTLLRRERGKRAALIGTIAHPERVPYAAALRLVRAYAQAPGFEAANRGMRAGRFTGLDQITVPLTLAWPEHDKLVQRPPHVPASAREFVLDGCGHMPTYDDPEAVARVLRAGASLS